MRRARLANILAYCTFSHLSILSFMRNALFPLHPPRLILVWGVTMDQNAGSSSGAVNYCGGGGSSYGGGGNFVGVDRHFIYTP